jgi:glycosyltransferase involved in cell wall biosynthesis
VRILYDGAIYGMQSAGGINRYFANLIGRLPADNAPTLTTYRDRQLHVPIHPNLRVLRFRRFRPGRISRKVEQQWLRWLTRRTPFDVAHPTHYYSHLFTRALERRRIPTVLTVWDMTHEVLPAQMPNSARTSLQKREAVLRADAVICISENTRNDLLERYQLPKDRVTVTYLASEIDIGQAFGSERVPEQPYLLYVGHRYPYKNFRRLLEAFARVAPLRPDLRLCVVGHPFGATERQEIEELRVARHVENVGQVTDPHLAKLYRCSLALVYPSLYEGFGIPPLEAMSCGTAVIASRAASIPEVVGDAGVLFDPFSTEELAEAILRVVDSPQAREAMIRRGRERVRLFSWDKMVADTCEVYAQLQG